MNTEVIKEIANQLGIAVSAVTKDVIPAYASYVIAYNISMALMFIAVASGLLVLARFFMAKSKQYADWEKENTSNKQNEAKDKYETFAGCGYVMYVSCIILAFFAGASIIKLIPWIVSPYGAFVHILMLQ